LTITRTTDSLLARLPPPAAINQRIGQLSRELSYLRRLLRLSLAASQAGSALRLNNSNEAANE
jgi:hypothetical protein